MSNLLDKDIKILPPEIQDYTQLGTVGGHPCKNSGGNGTGGVTSEVTGGSSKEREQYSTVVRSADSEARSLALDSSSRHCLTSDILFNFPHL